MVEYDDGSEYDSYHGHMDPIAWVWETFTSRFSLFISVTIVKYPRDDLYMTVFTDTYCACADTSRSVVDWLVTLTSLWCSWVCKWGTHTPSCWNSPTARICLAVHVSLRGLTWVWSYSIHNLQLILKMMNVIYRRTTKALLNTFQTFIPFTESSRKSNKNAFVCYQLNSCFCLEVITSLWITTNQYSFDVNGRQF